MKENILLGDFMVKQCAFIRRAYCEISNKSWFSVMQNYAIIFKLKSFFYENWNISYICQLQIIMKSRSKCESYIKESKQNTWISLKMYFELQMSAMILLNLWIHVILKRNHRCVSKRELNHERCIIRMKSICQQIISEATFSQLKHRGSEPMAQIPGLYCGV